MENKENKKVFNMEIDINKFIGLNGEYPDVLERLYRPVEENPPICDRDYYNSLPVPDNYKGTAKIISHNNNNKDEVIITKSER